MTADDRSNKSITMNNNPEMSINRNALDTDSPNTVQSLRESIIRALPELGDSEKSRHCWLLGTSGCHLCDVADSLMIQLSAVHPISYHYVDISDFDDLLMMQFATTIPVVLTPTQRLNYPFSILDLQQALA